MSQSMYAQVRESLVLPRIAEHVPSSPPTAALLDEHAPTMAEAVRHYSVAVAAASHAVGD